MGWDIGQTRSFDAIGLLATCNEYPTRRFFLATHVKS